MRPNINDSNVSYNYDTISIKKKNVSIFIAGVGAVGSTLVEFVNELKHPSFNFNIIGYCNSNTVVWSPKSAQTHQTNLEEQGESYALNDLFNKLYTNEYENLIFVDVTGSKILAEHYLDLLQNGVHIAASSKIANTLSQNYFDSLHEINTSGKTLFKYETNVGAGLPIISTLEGLLDSGDEITKITGVVSGTMTFIFNELQKGHDFSDIIIKAKEEGYSEPDPRDDLSGEDVARKFLILARTCGYKFEKEDIEVESLIPEELKNIDLEQFLEKLPEYNGHWKNKNTRALINNKHLRYVGTFENDTIKIGIKEVGAHSPIGGLKGTDNLIEIYTKRYAHSPIIVQGPGAGKEVTAAGLLADIILIAKSTR